jgi:hypothetical protein
LPLRRFHCVNLPAGTENRLRMIGPGHATASNACFNYEFARGETGVVTCTGGQNPTA